MSKIKKQKVEYILEKKDDIEVGDHVCKDWNISPWKVTAILPKGEGVSVMFNGVPASERILKPKDMKEYNFIRLINGRFRKL